MKNCKERNTCFYPRIFGIALVTMLTATTLWAKPKNVVEYTPFKSENPNATVFECEYIKGYDEGLTLSGNFLYCNGNEPPLECSSIAVYGWKKKKGGWEKLGEYKPKQSEYYFGASVLDDDSDKYSHYAVEVEAPENSLTFSAKGEVNSWWKYCMEIFLHVSEEYEKLIREKREAERAEQERLAAEEKAKKEAELIAAYNAKGKQIAKGYVYHGIDEANRNAKLFAGGALEEGHAYYISSYIAGSGGSTGAAYMGSYPDYTLVEYANLEVKAEVVTRTSYKYNAWLMDYTGSTVPVVVAGKKGRPIVLGVVDLD